jgi:hypothetical protein
MIEDNPKAQARVQALAPKRLAELNETYAIDGVSIAEAMDVHITVIGIELTAFLATLPRDLRDSAMRDLVDHVQRLAQREGGSLGKIEQWRLEGLIS